MIAVNNVSKGFGGRLLFENVQVAFSPGNRYGLTGPNGSGKSTFMKILIAEEETDAGSVQLPRRVGWLRQEHTAFDEMRVLDTVIMGNKRLWDAMETKEEIYARAEFTDADNDMLGEMECVVAEEDGYSAESEAAVLLEGLGIHGEFHEGKMQHLQGGLKLRVLLAQALFGAPEALLLDEPTNHLDLDSIRWLEVFLTNYDGTLVVISHDRRFLNIVCNRIADIDFETIITYTGNYDDMVRTKAQMRGRIEKDNVDKAKKIEQLQTFIDRFKAGTRASQTRSRARQIEKLRPDEIKRSNIARPFIRFPSGIQSGRDVIEIKDLSKSFDGTPIFTNFNCQVARGDKVAVIGKNGIGKTTLLRSILGELEADSGFSRMGHQVTVGYFSQHHREDIEAGTTVYQWLFNHRPEVGEQEVRAVLGRMLFSGTDGAKPTGTLSGGEAARLMMCKLILKEYNLLLMDEPTNHLDLESISALRDAIEKYEGTIIYVTHDRDLASAATRIFAYAGENNLIDYDGSLGEYLDWLDKQLASS
jgi:ATPase subunit of ABC transporter with duplicated ATPase domains